MVVGKESKSGSFVVVIFKIREVPACEMVKKEILRDEGIWWCRRKDETVETMWTEINKLILKLTSKCRGLTPRISRTILKNKLEG